MKQISICTGGGQACDQAVLEHIGAATSVLTNDDTGRLVVAVTLTESIVIPAKESAYLVGMVSGQRDSGFATEAISPKILSHYSFPHPKSELTIICFSREWIPLPAIRHVEAAFSDGVAML